MPDNPFTISCPEEESKSYWKRIFAIEKPVLKDIGLKLGAKRAEYPICGGYMSQMYVNQFYFEELSYFVQREEFDQFFSSVNEILRLHGPRYHLFFDVFVIALSIAMCNVYSASWSLLGTFLLFISTIFYQYKLDKTKHAVQEYLDIANEGIYMQRGAHWKMGPREFHLSLDTKPNNLE